MSTLAATGVDVDSPRQCQWCGERFPRTTEKAIHVHEAHPETIGRGATRSVAWSCACGQRVAGGAERCTCGRKHWKAQ